MFLGSCASPSNTIGAPKSFQKLLMYAMEGINITLIPRAPGNQSRRLIFPRYSGHLEKNGIHSNEEGRDERGENTASV